MDKRAVVISILIILLFVGLAAFLIRSQSLAPENPINPSPTSNPEITATPQSTNAPTSSASPVTTRPLVTAPQSNSKVTSPLIVKGKVPPGWMFEGVLPIKLLDANRNLITQSQAKEVTPGSWSSGSDVEFSATLNFTTNAKSGFLVLEKDNPSGLPENANYFEIPINF